MSKNFVPIRQLVRELHDIIKRTVAVAYLGFHLGGGFKIFLKKWGYLQCISMQRVAKPRVC